MNEFISLRVHFSFTFVSLNADFPPAGIGEDRNASGFDVPPPSVRARKKINFKKLNSSRTENNFSSQSDWFMAV